MARAGYVDIIEAAYAQTTSDAEWLRRVFELAAPVIDLGRGVRALRYKTTADARIELLDMTGTENTRSIETASRDYLDHARGPIIDRMFARTDAMFLRRDAAGPPSDNPKDFEYWSSRGVEEAFSVVGYDPSGHGVMLTAMAPPNARVPAKKRDILRCVAAHLASAIRLRLAPPLAEVTDLDDAGVEAVLAPDGRVVEAAGQARDAQARRALTDAGTQVKRARSRTLEPEEAVAVWRALWAGRWTLVERQERDGRCYLVARRNEPRLAEPKALSARERQVLLYAQMGHSQKFISFELGLSQSTVAGYLASGLKKLGLRNRTELTKLATFGGHEE